MQDFISLMKSLINTLHDFRRIGNFGEVAKSKDRRSGSYSSQTLYSIEFIRKSVAAVSTFLTK